MAANPNLFPKRHLTLRQQDARTAWLLLIPSLLVILGVTLWPVISTFILSFFNAPTGINQVRTFVGLGNYIGYAQGPDLLGDDRAHPVLHGCLGGSGAGAGAGHCPADPLPPLGLAVPALQPDHPLGCAHHRQRRHVALDLQRRFWRLERPADAVGVDQTLRPLADPAGHGDEPGDRGGCLAHDAVRGPDPAGCPGHAARGPGRGRRRGWRQCLAAVLADPAAAAAPGHPGGADRPHGGCLPRVRYRLHHHQRRPGLQDADHHLSDLSEFIFVMANRVPVRRCPS